MRLFLRPSCISEFNQFSIGPSRAAARPLKRKETWYECEENQTKVGAVPPNSRPAIRGRTRGVQNWPADIRVCSKCPTKWRRVVRIPGSSAHRMFFSWTFSQSIMARMILKIKLAFCNLAALISNIKRNYLSSSMWYDRARLSEISLFW